MKKLIKLYYEHKLDLLKRDMRVNGATEREIELVDIEKVDEDELEKNLNKLSDLKPFIKWLVENDKIDRDKVKEEYRYMEYEPFDYMEDFFKKDGWLIMLLSISDTPIDFLYGIIKN